ncbi:MAG TPA: hypothetical protein VE596_09380 [Gaiellaceae bacterium]|jgi:hypothetical protein|nr:hypothetical protein [Gaiellaceae bacterium]
MKYDSLVRGLLNQTLAQLGYARVPDPQEPEERRVRLLDEFHRLLVQREEALRRANTRAKLALVISELLAEAREKVARDEAWAERYAEERSDEQADIVRTAGKSAPADWHDL